MTEVIYRVGSLAEQLSQTQLQLAASHDRAQAAEVRLATLERDVANLQRDWSLSIEALCVRSPELRPLFIRRQE